jgi:TldD protein
MHLPDFTAPGVRYYDIRHVRGESTLIDIDNGVIESGGSSFFDKAVIRVLGPQGWGAIALDTFTPDQRAHPEEFMRRALRLAELTQEPVLLADAPRSIRKLPGISEDPRTISLEEKTRILADIEKAAKMPGVVNTRATYIERAEQVTFTDSSGFSASTEVVRSGFSITAVAARDGLIQSGRESRHTLRGFNLRHQEPLATEAGERAVALLDAKPVKGGPMRTLLDPEIAGVFAHEAVGHASEGDLIKEGNSVLGGRIGERIGVPELTIVDDPGLHEFGFEPVDAEGVGVQRTEIIRDGVVHAFLHNRETLAALGNGIGGHARAEAGDLPLVRMSNTFIENGNRSFGELLEECGNGILLKGSRGGQVDPGRGVFLFNAEFGYMIDHGECGSMVRDVSLSGEILTTLHQIRGIGNDRIMHQGYCGKGGQSVPVSDGSPHILLENAVVGGSGMD